VKLHAGREIQVALVVLAAGCAPRLTPLVGEIAPATLPKTQILPGHHQIVFQWEYSDPDMSGRGDGAVRTAWPDSLRLDFFIAGGLAGGGAVLIGDSLQVPGIELTRRLIPPPTLLWAALGRTKLPVTRDTVIRVEGALIRADFGRPVDWRATFRGDTLVRLEHVEGGRIVEWVDRADPTRVEYRQESARRSLRLHITGQFEVNEFDAAIWHIDR
jgi:hypothetical protein